MTDEDPSKIFRESSFQEMRASERIDQRLIVNKVEYRWVFYFFLISLALIGLWILFGSIPLKVLSKGVLIQTDALKSIQSHIDGRVQEIHVQPRQQIKAGQVLAKLQNPATEIVVNYATQHLAQIQAEYEALNLRIQSERRAREKSLQDKVEADTIAISNQIEAIQLLEKALEVQRGLLKKGLINATDVLTTEQQLLKAKTELESLKAALQASKFELTKSYRKEDLEAKEAQLRKAQEEAALALQEQSYLSVTSPFDASIVEVDIVKDQLVNKGDTLMILERKSDEQLRFYAYVSADEAKRIKVGNPAVVQLSNFKEEEYGSIRGVVASVSPFPLSEKRLELDLHNPTLTRYLMENRPSVFQVKIELERDPGTPSGYKWTSGKGPNALLTTGSVGTAKLIVERVRPLYYLIPIWRD